MPGHDVDTVEAPLVCTARCVGMVREIDLQMPRLCSSHRTYNVPVLHTAMQLVILAVLIPPLRLASTDPCIPLLNELMKACQTWVLEFLVKSLKLIVSVLEWQDLPCALATTLVEVREHEGTVVITYAHARSAIAVSYAIRFALHHGTSHIHELLIHVHAVTSENRTLQQHACLIQWMYKKSVKLGSRLSLR